MSLQARRGMDCFASLAMTASKTSHAPKPPAAPRARGFASSSALTKIQRAQGKPGAHSTRDRAQKCTRVTARCAGTPGLPCAMVLRLIARSPWRRIPLASIADELTIRRSPPCNPSRARRCRVHRIPHPTSVTIAIRPSWWDGMRGVVRVIWVNHEAEYFFGRDWTGQIKLTSLKKFARPRTRRAAVTTRVTSGSL